MVHLAFAAGSNQLLMAPQMQDTPVTMPLSCRLQTRVLLKRFRAPNAVSLAVNVCWKVM